MYNIYYISFHCFLTLKLGFGGCREQKMKCQALLVFVFIHLVIQIFAVYRLYETCFLTSWVSNCLTSHREDLKSSNLTLNRITRWGTQTSVGN